MPKRVMMKNLLYQVTRSNVSYVQIIYVVCRAHLCLTFETNDAVPERAVSVSTACVR